MLRRSLMTVMAGSALLIAGPAIAAPPGGDGGIFAKAPWNTGKGKKAAKKKPADEQAQTASETPAAPATGAADGNAAAPSGTAATPAANGAAPSGANGAGAAGNSAEPVCTVEKPC